MRSSRLARVQTGSGLVETEKLGVSAHGAGNFQTALGTIGQVTGRIIGTGSQANAVEPIAGLLFRLCRMGLVVLDRPSRPPIV